MRVRRMSSRTSRRVVQRSDDGAGGRPAFPGSGDYRNRDFHCDPCRQAVQAVDPKTGGVMALRRTHGVAITAGMAALGLLLGACGSKSSPGGSTDTGGATSASTSASAPSSSAPAANFTACMVTDTGGIDDKSFNASAWSGMQKAQADGKATVSYVQSKAETDYATNINKLEGQNCK